MQTATTIKPVYYDALCCLIKFCVRRRVAITLVGFITLIVANVLWIGARPLDPLNWHAPNVLLALVLILAGTIVRSWSAGTLNKSREVTQDGPYALVRHPLYMGSFLLMLGFCWLCKDVLSLLFVLGPMIVIYSMQIQLEEQRLATLFADQWNAYAERVPAFLPRKVCPQVFTKWSFDYWLLNREYKAVLAVASGIVGVKLWFMATQL